jgi:hypothetical protein
MNRSTRIAIFGAALLAGCAQPPVAPAPPTIDMNPASAPIVAPPADNAPTATTTPTHGPCKFNRLSLTFEGTKLEQAKCLLRPVKRWGELGAELTTLPAPLDKVGTAAPISKAQFRRYLVARSINENDLGGPINKPVSQTNDGLSATYFVIHDTSSPNYKSNPFPAHINAASSPVNDLTRWMNTDPKIAHVFINRAGQSVTVINFRSPWRATKLESRFAGAKARGRFLHIENIQPRRSLSTAFEGNDALAPGPGFTENQYRRLALVYLAASLRAGEMLVPAFHAVMDNDFPGAHDDPQKFQLDLWARMLTEEIAAAQAF